MEVLDKWHKESKCYRNSEEPGGFRDDVRMRPNVGLGHETGGPSRHVTAGLRHF